MAHAVMVHAVIIHIVMVPHSRIIVCCCTNEMYMVSLGFMYTKHPLYYNLVKICLHALYHVSDVVTHSHMGQHV